MDSQYILLCLQDSDIYDEPKNNWTYVQATRRRFTKEQAEYEMEVIAPSRKPVIVEVPPIQIDDKGYPVQER